MNPDLELIANLQKRIAELEAELDATKAQLRGARALVNVLHPHPFTSAHPYKCATCDAEAKSREAILKASTVLKGDAEETLSQRCPDDCGCQFCVWG